ncbi:MAG: hypothetical protein HY331_13680 [Chloroflexi bacterium]|nr:hypothetical protein [Chloroflexota bacterium]
MTSELVVSLMRMAWLTLAGMMIFSRVVFQLAGPVWMRAFLNRWKESATKRGWGAASLLYGLFMLLAAMRAVSDLGTLDILLVALLVVMLVGDGLLNVVPGGFSTFKEKLQDAWVRRHRGTEQVGDRALFGTVNVLLGLASAGMGAAVIAYRPIDVLTIAGCALLAVLLTAALIAVLRLERGPIGSEHDASEIR